MEGYIKAELKRKAMVCDENYNCKSFTKYMIFGAKVGVIKGLQYFPVSTIYSTGALNKNIKISSRIRFYMQENVLYCSIKSDLAVVTYEHRLCCEVLSISEFNLH